VLEFLVRARVRVKVRAEVRDFWARLGTKRLGYEMSGSRFPIASKFLVKFVFVRTFVRLVRGAVITGCPCDNESNSRSLSWSSSVYPAMH